MSWWNKNFTDLASQALKNAQKKIDKVLDIEEESTETKPVSKLSSEEVSANETTSGRSSWSMPWGSSYYEESSLTNADTTKPNTAKEVDANRKLKRENSGSSLKQKSRKSTSGQKQKSSDGIKIEHVGNFPDIKSQEKVDNWDISSGWKEEFHDLEPVKTNQDALTTTSQSASDQTFITSSPAKSCDLLSTSETDTHDKNTQSDSEDMMKDMGNNSNKILEMGKPHTEDIFSVHDSELSVLTLSRTTDLTKNTTDEDTSSSIEVIPSSGNTGSSNTPLSDEPSHAVNKEGDDVSAVPSHTVNKEGDEFITVPSHTVNKDGDDVRDVPSHTVKKEGDDISDVPSHTVDKEGDGVSAVPSHTVNKEGDDISDEPCHTVTNESDVVSDEPCHIVTKESDVISDEPSHIVTKESDVISDEPSHIVMKESDVVCDEPSHTVTKESDVVSDEPCHTFTKESDVFSDEPSHTVAKEDDIINDELCHAAIKEGDMGASSGSGDSIEDTGASAGQGPPLSPSASSSVCSSDTNKLDSSMDTQTSEETVVDKVPEDEDEEDTKRGGESGDNLEEGKNNDSLYSVSSSSSYVKCMIEEAMEDNSKIEDSNSDCHSLGGEKSECSRSTGGHESGDEIDTTTSSDIEIISTPNSNGDGNKILDLSPLKIALQKTARRGSPTHRRTDSQSSSSTQSRDGQGEQLSPGRDSLEDDGHYVEERKLSLEEHRLEPVSEEYRSDPYSNPQKLLKLQTVPEHSEVLPQSNDSSLQIKKMSVMAEVIQVREQKLLQLSKENNDLMEANNILRSQLQQVEEAREVELEDMNNVSAEFTKRIGDADRKANLVIKERDAIKKQMQTMQDEFDRRFKNMEQELEEKNVQISELLQEGEKLSRQQLQVNNITKKLRAKEKENDSLITSQKKKLENQKTELEHLRNVCESKDIMEKKQSDAINQLNTAVQKQEREIAKLKGESEDAQERVRGLQAALDNSYKEIAELNKSNAAQDSRAQENALSVEMRVREELRLSLEREQHSYKQEREALIMQIEDLRLSMSKQEKDHNRREDLLRQEIADLQMQLQEDEARNQDVTQSVTSATRPLLRQIENLQSTFAAQSSAWEKLERNLTDRLTECQSQLAMAVERERSSSEKLMDLTTQMKTYESQNTQLRQDKSHLTAQLDMVKSKVQVLQDAKNNESAQIEVIKQQMSLDLHEVRKEKVFLETQLDMERTKVEQERKKLSFAQDQIAALEREAQRPISRGSASSRPESVTATGESAFNTSFNQDDIEKTFMLSPGSLGNRTNLYEALRQSGAVNVLENLQSQLKLREGEIIQLQSDIQHLERTRESMARELVNLTNKNEELMSKVEELPNLNQQLQDINLRYNSLLQMYGEKVEEAEELRMDLTDVKDMYKMQIDHLLAK